MQGLVVIRLILGKKSQIPCRRFLDRCRISFLLRLRHGIDRRKGHLGHLIRAVGIHRIGVTVKPEKLSVIGTYRRKSHIQHIDGMGGNLHVFFKVQNGIIDLVIDLLCLCIQHAVGITLVGDMGYVLFRRRIRHIGCIINGLRVLLLRRLLSGLLLRGRTRPAALVQRIFFLRKCLPQRIIDHRRDLSFTEASGKKPDQTQKQ